MQARIDIVRSGKALYAGISKYPADLQEKAYKILSEAKVPCLLSQYRASIFDTASIRENFSVAAANGSGVICFSPLAQGLLTDKYLNGIPDNSRAAKATGFLQLNQVTPERIKAAAELNEIAKKRGESLACLALRWLLDDRRVTSVIIGASTVRQLQSNLEVLKDNPFSEDEKEKISETANSHGVSF